MPITVRNSWLDDHRQGEAAAAECKNPPGVKRTGGLLLRPGSCLYSSRLSQVSSRSQVGWNENLANSRIVCRRRKRLRKCAERFEKLGLKPNAGGEWAIPMAAPDGPYRRFQSPVTTGEGSVDYV